MVMMSVIWYILLDDRLSCRKLGSDRKAAEFMDVILFTFKLSVKRLDSPWNILGNTLNQGDSNKQL